MTETKEQLPSVALAKEIKENPYARFMTKSLCERVNELQAYESTGHWAGLRDELTLARATLGDVVQRYAAVHTLPDGFANREEIVISAGSMLRAAIREIGELAHKAAQIEATLRDKHDPAVTLNFMQQTVKVIDNTLRMAEERGEVVDAEALIMAITSGVDNGVRLPFDSPGALNDANRRAVGINPASVTDTVRGMIETVPAA